MGMLLGLAILVLDVMAVIDVFNSPKDSEKKLLWVILIVVLPFLGPLLYFLFARSGSGLGRRGIFR
ncbi:MAG: PLD nuclease N-terminal domain-containing protein [Elusimicrobia bacterium]|nr:PLD nuclease N-terminal domain-containing protein [Elusimicrobiota bacterium]